ncbi:MAG: NADH-quinone oxidoreductase subunit L [bacterium]|nr:NADH-quinone oxidoreductase subunit L [bacterium]
MNYSAILLAVIFVPTLGSLFLPLLGKASEKLRNAASLIFVAVAFAGSCLLWPAAREGAAVFYGLPLGFNFSVGADGLAVFMALVSSLISSLIVLYSFRYISHYDNRNEYYFMVTLFLGSMMGLIFSRNLILLYIFWEITAIASWRLIGFFREPLYVLRADKSFLVTGFGALLMLLGFLMLGTEAGSFELSDLSAHYANTAVPHAAVLLILAGILSKSATLPFHTWLPDAGVAPSPVTALLHAAVLVKIGVYVYARLFVASLPADIFTMDLVGWIAAASALVSAGAALVDTDLKRIVAFSTISQIGFIFLGLSQGNEIGLAGGLLYILTHGLAKAGLFLGAGIVEQNTHTKDVTKLGGLYKTMPVTAVSFLLCSLSVMGIPPFGGFFGKYMVIAAPVQAGRWPLALVFIAGAFLTIMYLFRVFRLVFLGECSHPEAKEGSKSMVAVIAVLAGLSLIAGVWISAPSGMVQSIASSIFTQVK